MRTRKLASLVALAVSSLALGAMAQQAGEPAKPDSPTTSTKSPQAQYESAPYAAGAELHQTSNPKAPKMTQAEFDRARQIYFERCAGCHGVLRKGATGKPLTPDITVEKGTEYLKVFIGTARPPACPTGDLGRVRRENGRPDGALHPARPSHAARVRWRTWRSRGRSSRSPSARPRR
jgi:nitrite reductase (NO-forming)/hydroxylamine reductase